MDICIHKYSKIFDLYVEFSTNKAVSEFINYLHERHIKISNFEIGKSKIKGEGPNALVCIEIEDASKRMSIIDEIHNLKCIRYVEEI